MQILSVSIKQACACIGIGRTKLYQLIKEGKIEVTRLGRRTLVRTDSIIALVSEGAR